MLAIGTSRTTSPLATKTFHKCSNLLQLAAILLVGSNPRWESPVLNARIRKRYLSGHCTIASIGPALDLTYPVERLGAGPATLRDLAEGSAPVAGRV